MWLLYVPIQFLARVGTQGLISGKQGSEVSLTKGEKVVQPLHSTSLRLLIKIIWGASETLQCLGTVLRDSDLIGWRSVQHCKIYSAKYYSIAKSVVFYLFKDF